MSSSPACSLSSRSSLIRLCVECHESYQPGRVTPFAHLQHFAHSAHPQLSQPTHSASLDFLSDVFLGIDRLHELLDMTADALYTLQAAQLARRDRTLYLVYLLLILDRLPTMGWDELAAYIRCQPPHAMLPLLAFMFDSGVQDGWMRQQWQTVYDVAHVDSQLLHSLRQHQQQAKALMERLTTQLQSEKARKEQMAALAGETAAVTSQAATIPQPFTLSQSKPKALPAPIALPATYRAREIPPAVTRSLSLQQIELHKQQRRQAMREQTALALHTATQPSLATSQRPSSLSRVKQELEDRLRDSTRQLSFARSVPASVHTADADSVAHKPTAASILREEGRYRKERAEEAERLLRFESELRDEAAFQQWQTRKRAEDEQRRREDIARRKQVRAQAQHDAQLSVHRMVQHKQHQASSSKEAMDRQLQARQTEEESQRKKRKESVRQLSAAEEESVQASLAAVRRRKKDAAEAVAAESQRLSDERERRVEEERAEKRRLMLSIQAMEKLAGERAKRTTVMEESSTGGLNLLSDMSIAEMRARLALLEEAERQHVERKRERIEAEKRTKASVLSAMQQQHAALRAQHSEHRETERRQKRASQQTEAWQLQAQLAEEGRETAVRMEERKKELIAAAVAIAAQVASNKQLTNTLQQQAAQSRERAHNDIVAAAERREAITQQRADRQQRVEAELERRKLSDLTQVRAAAKLHTEHARAETDRRLAEAASEYTRVGADERSAHSSHYRLIVEQRQRVKQTLAAANPFAARASDVDVQRGKQTAEQRKQAEERWRSAQRVALSKQLGRADQPVSAVEEEKQQLSADNTLITGDTLTAQQQPHLGNAALAGAAG